MNRHGQILAKLIEMETVQVLERPQHDSNKNFDALIFSLISVYTRRLAGNVK